MKCEALRTIRFPLFLLISMGNLEIKPFSPCYIRLDTHHESEFLTQNTGFDLATVCKGSSHITQHLAYLLNWPLVRDLAKLSSASVWPRLIA